MSAVTADERVLLPLWAEAFGAVVGWAPSVTPLRARPAVPAALAAEHLALRFDGPIEPVEMLGSVGHFRHSPALAAHVRRLGFDWDDAGVVRAVPTPDAFNALADALLPPRVGYRTGYMRRDAGSMSLGPFLRCYLEGRVPVQLGSEALYRGARGAMGAGAQAAMAFHFTSFAHDLSVHALNYQIVPWEVVDAIRARIVAAVPERVAAWAHPDALGPLTLTTFFDNDVNRLCYAVWSASADLDDAVARFRDNADQLLRCLDLRLDETLRGTGDVPSGDANDLAPLTPWPFTLRGAQRPPSITDADTAGLRAALAGALARAPTLPLDLPAYRVRLLDARPAGTHGAALLVGWEAPVAALEFSPGAASDAAVDVTVRELHGTAARVRPALDAMAARLRASLTAARWAEAQALASRLRAVLG